MDDVDIVKATSDLQFTRRVGSQCIDANEQSVDTVVDQLVVVNVGTHTVVVTGKRTSLLETWLTVVGFFKAVRRGAHRRTGTVRYLVEGQRWPRIHHLDRVNRLLEPADFDIATATKANVGVVH